MRKAVDIIGKKYGRLTVIEKVKSTTKSSRWLCKCKCGNYKEVDYSALKRGMTISCGCYKKESKEHGKCDERLYKIWENMKDRCYRKKNNHYKDYGGRNITICDEWLNDFMSFYNWAINNNYEDGLTIDRINNDGDYEPSNCRWVNMKIQANNKRNSIIVEYNNKKMTLKQFADKYKLNYKIIWRKYRKENKSLEEILRYAGYN